MSQDSNNSVEAFVNDVSPVNDQGQIVCYHRILAKRLVSHTLANPERAFFTCPKNSSDPEKCKFFIWEDNQTLCSVLNSKKPAVGMSTSVTPQRPSQVQRALFSRTPTLAAAALQKRPRTPSPTPSSSCLSGPLGAVKHRRVDNTISNRAGSNGLTPSTIPSQRTQPVPDSKGAAQSDRKAARLKSIQDALLDVQATPRDPSLTSSRDLSVHNDVEGISQFSSNQSLSDVPRHAAPPSLSQNKQYPHLFSRHAADAHSDVGTSIDTEDEMEDMESKAVQTSPVDDESSVIEDFWSTTPPRSVIGSPVTVADIGAGPSRIHPDWSPRVPRASAAERGAWSPVAPQTPGREGTSRTFTPGGNDDDAHPGMLLTPPGSSQPHIVSGAGAGPSASQRGRALLQEMLASPTASKGKGPELLDSASRIQQWQSLQDDPSIPEYVAKLERREKAAQKSAEIKGRKISQLEEELQRLRNEKRALEETVAALQMRR
ncbi:uncharacterized protein TRAVEDRAFT_43662 [Trametes versicolor FP-101664 SS1]|uniref:uncharacterized protein n=1 Tax=Trametes versicolor (strain FP-101664) TaxID=717944 RepID=UPI00046243E2|nr:uncharacterized protein TRAVEDRAFT_43662 [Trametes versicolor FP-101664 SS1]EIW63367.1 hypothetical protein TRAVEDRAFT_43662 [Trametes versicolor FP-101664 SS1]